MRVKFLRSVKICRSRSRERKIWHPNRYRYHCLLLLVVIFGSIPAYAQDLYGCIAVGKTPDGRYRSSGVYNYPTQDGACVEAVNRLQGLSDIKVVYAVRNEACAIVIFGNGYGYAAGADTSIIGAVTNAKKLALDKGNGRLGESIQVLWLIASAKPATNGKFSDTYYDLLNNIPNYKVPPNYAGRGASSAAILCQDTDPSAPHFLPYCDLPSTASG